MAEHVCHRGNLCRRYASDCCHGAELHRRRVSRWVGLRSLKQRNNTAAHALLFRIQSLICLISMVGQRCCEPTDLLVIVQREGYSCRRVCCVTQAIRLLRGVVLHLDGLIARVHMRMSTCCSRGN